jgi:hypothetical protein
MAGLDIDARRLAATCLIVALGVTSAACGGSNGEDDRSAGPDTTRQPTAQAGRDASRDKMTTAERREAERAVRKLTRDHGQSRLERSINRDAKRLQAKFVAGALGAACAQLTPSTAAQIAGEAHGRRSCPRGLRRVAEREGEAVPLVAWVRVRGQQGNVMVRAASGGIALSHIVRERGRWTFEGLELIGIEWPWWQAKAAARFALGR